MKEHLDKESFEGEEHAIELSTLESYSDACGDLEDGAMVEGEGIFRNGYMPVGSYRFSRYPIRIACAVSFIVAVLLCVGLLVIPKNDTKPQNQEPEEHPPYTSVDYRTHTKATPTPTVAPTLDYSVLPQNLSDCIQSRDRLLAAVDAYLFLKFSRQNQTTNPLSISNWCVHSIQDMRHLFDYDRNPLASQYNEPLNHWNFSSVIHFTQFFQGAKSFNQPVDIWDTSNAISFKGMFFGADTFNQPLNAWDTSRVETMSSMFRSADSMNQPLDQWNVSQVLEMSHMFDGAKTFKQNLCSWEPQLAPKMDHRLKLDSVFLGTQCPTKMDPLVVRDGYDDATEAPIVHLDPAGPFCFTCHDRRLS
ncbi:Mycoplasma protein of unknown function, DUF285 [Seminavis robusta]|uniref:BspA family leucine-rich repeat surface protein n=1 Tax=Seminavis robusta TaxID=568900 RepID=A0A9N8HXX2_9STRA|nr:Mycoplasma protein of unknown function, DUF285 [Seminavis robusta]|eukprot:Sro1888_g303630.1 Mycoplasma protein of unknown function, DUF285 (361) ;mRNA; r:8378-9460